MDRRAYARCAAALEPFASGAYVNTLADEGAVGVRRAYPPDKLARLAALKDAYDPENVFHLNQNIAPSRRRVRRTLSRQAAELVERRGEGLQTAERTRPDRPDPGAGRGVAPRSA